VPESHPSPEKGRKLALQEAPRKSQNWNRKGSKTEKRRVSGYHQRLYRHLNDAPIFAKVGAIKTFRE